jgi:ribose-phosphate pyrophosphokinase
MKLNLFSGRANLPLAKAVAAGLGIELGSCTVEDFPDGELQVEIDEDVQGKDVYVIQPTCPPVANHLLELLLLADSCKRCGAARLTGVIPYFGYARQDRRLRGKEPVAARLLADLLSTRFDRIITLDLHTAAIEGFFAIPVEHLTAVPLLAKRIKEEISSDSTIVAPDLGAIKLAHRYADYLELPVTYAHKLRISGDTVEVRQLIGEVKGCLPVLVDDMISTGGTMVAAVEALLEQDCLPEVVIVATHGLLVGDAIEQLGSLPIKALVTTDSIRQSEKGSLPWEVISISQLLADAIRQTSLGESRGQK